MTLNVKLSKIMARRVRAKVDRCRMNAALAHCQARNSIFVSGLVLAPDGKVYGHGWIEGKYGTLIDPSFFFDRTIDDIKSTHYFPQIKETVWHDGLSNLSITQAFKLIIKEEHQPITLYLRSVTSTLDDVKQYAEKHGIAIDLSTLTKDELEPDTIEGSFFDVCITEYLKLQKGGYDTTAKWISKSMYIDD